MEEVRYGIELDINSVRLVYKAINEMLEKWPGGDASEQEHLFQLKNGFYKILLENQYQNNIK
jgi:hypothetical protein